MQGMGRGAAMVKPAWMQKAEEDGGDKDEPDESYEEAKAAFEQKWAGHQAIVPAGRPPPNDDDVLKPIAPAPGPISPANCKAMGTGLNGGTAMIPTTFNVVAHDKDGRRIYDGGASIKVKVTPGPTVEDGEPEDGSVRDLGDGSYMCTYSVKKKGDYTVHVTVSRAPIAGSPFPVFFSAPAPPPVPVPGALGQPVMPGTPGGAVNPVQQAMLANLAAAQAQALNNGARPVPAANLPNMPLPPPTQPQAEELSRTLHVGNVSPLIDGEQLKVLFGHFGTVTDCRQAGDSKQYAFIEFATAAECAQAIAANGMVVGDRALKVEIAKTARMVKTPAVPAVNPMAHLQMLQMQQQTALLQQQVAAQRAAAAAAAAAAASRVNAEAVAAARIAEINKRLTTGDAGGGTGGGTADGDSKGKERKRSRSRSRDRSRDKGRRRSRSRSRDKRRRRSRSRSRSRDRRRRKSRSRSRDRRRVRSRERTHRRRSRSRSPHRRRRDRSGSRERRRSRERKSSRKKDKSSRRSRSRSPAGKERAEDAEKEGTKEAEEAKEEAKAEGAEEEAKEEGAKEEAAGGEGDGAAPKADGEAEEAPASKE